VQRIDLTREQTKAREDQGMVEMDDLDLLDATIDPMDIKTRIKVKRLEEEIESEKNMIKAKYVFRHAFQEHDPMKISEWFCGATNRERIEWNN